MGTLVLVVFLAFSGKAAAVMCSQCDSDLDPRCLSQPPAPRNCTLCTMLDLNNKCTKFTEVHYCIIERRYINDTLIRITRDCSPYFVPNTCQMDEDYGTPIKVCYTTCKQNGCNSSNAVFTSSGFMCLGMLTFIMNKVVI